ncbi:MAG: hypothetical protein R2690_07935 [Acidimicrobiales bacterium]
MAAAPATWPPAAGWSVLEVDLDGSRDLALPASSAWEELEPVGVTGIAPSRSTPASAGLARSAGDAGWPAAAARAPPPPAGTAGYAPR